VDVMGGKYILRLDDACPTMDIEKWNKIEYLCDKYHIKPIVAVIPNNEDKFLKRDYFDENFWDKVRKWQEKGWHIALHGYNHVYISQESGFLPFNKKSEFAGLPYEVQKDKIKKGWEIFQKEKIICNIWVAPSHSFDKITLKVLKDITSINIISDGIALFPFKKYGFKWIPQQFWRFRKMPFGIWTGCFHPNEMKEEDFKELEKFIKKNYKNFIDINKLKYKKTCVINIIFKNFYLFVKRIKDRINDIKL
jgi:hypothetical protein